MGTSDRRRISRRLMNAWWCLVLLRCRAAASALLSHMADSAAMFVPTRRRALRRSSATSKRVMAVRFLAALSVSGPVQ